MKPVFKARFAAPVASSTPNSSSIETAVERQNGTAQITNSTPTKKSKKKPEISNTDKENEKLEKETSLTDSQYENIFASVSARVLAEDFLQLDELFAGSDYAAFETRPKSKNEQEKKRKSKDLGGRKQTKSGDGKKSTDMGESKTEKSTNATAVTAVESFTEAISKKSSNLAKRINEVTPTLSPLEITDETVLVKEPEPKRKEKKQKTKAVGKRKSLEYPNKKEKSGHEENGLSSKNRNQEDISDEKGTWVQCSACDKWRFLSDCEDPASLPDEWHCAQNTNKKLSSCFAPEEAWDDSSQDSFIYAKFTPGSIVWAKMTGYPSWPAMVDREPDFNTFYETFPDGSVSYYHVVFLDDRVSRAWISHRNIEVYRVNETPIKLPRNGKRNDFAKDLEPAKTKAQEALKMTVQERLKKFSFQSRFHGKSHWSRDKNAMERKMKKKAQEKAKRPKEIVRETKTESALPKKVPRNESPRKSETSAEKTYIDAEKEKKDSSYVSGSEYEAEACLNGEGNENGLFGSMLVIDEAHDQSDEIPFVQLENDEPVKSVNFDPDIFTMEMEKRPYEENSEPIDLKKRKGADNNDGNDKESELLDQSEKRKADGPHTSNEDEYWLAPDKPGEPSDVLFEDVEMQVDDEGLHNPTNEADWENFEKMVME